MRRLLFRAGLASAMVLVLQGGASANGGLVVRLKDGSTPINQPDLFASALSTAWGDGSRFCTALRSIVSTAPGGVAVTSCVAQPVATISVVMSGRTPSVVFSVPVTLQGSETFHNATCPFTETFRVGLQAPLVIAGDMLAVSSISFDTAMVRGSATTEIWAAACSGASGQHPAGISQNVSGWAQTAASDANFPGPVLDEALAPFEATLKRALSGTVYEPSATTGDILFTVVDSVTHARPGEAPPPRFPKRPQN